MTSLPVFHGRKNPYQCLRPWFCDASVKRLPGRLLTLSADPFLFPTAIFNSPGEIAARQTPWPSRPAGGALRCRGPRGPSGARGLRVRSSCACRSIGYLKVVLKVGSLDGGISLLPTSLRPELSGTPGTVSAAVLMRVRPGWEGCWGGEGKADNWESSPSVRSH